MKAKKIGIWIAVFVLVFGAYVVIGLLQGRMSVEPSDSFEAFCLENMEHLQDEEWLLAHGAEKQADGSYRDAMIQMEPYVGAEIVVYPQILANYKQETTSRDQPNFLASGKQVYGIAPHFFFWPLHMGNRMEERSYYCQIGKENGVILIITTTEDSDFTQRETDVYDCLAMDRWPDMFGPDTTGLTY